MSDAAPDDQSGVAPEDSSGKIWTVPACMDCLPAVFQEVEDYASSQGCPHDVILKLLLTVDEIVSNIILHGYRDEPDPTLRIKAEIGNNRAVLEFLDQARAYDPVSRPAPDNLDQAPEQRPPGGLGLHLVKELSDEAHYRRENGWNRLSVIFTLP
jgi:anti-sigma regulatory factor (Ser/Thr protein kinase)